MSARGLLGAISDAVDAESELGLRMAMSTLVVEVFKARGSAQPMKDASRLFAEVAKGQEEAAAADAEYDREPIDIRSHFRGGGR